MSVERKQSLFIIAYPGKETADEVYQTLRALEKQDKIDIKTAATLYRAEDGKLRLKHRRRLTVWKGAFGVGAIGLILAGTGAGFLAGAVVGALYRPTHRRDLLDGGPSPRSSRGWRPRLAYPSRPGKVQTISHRALK